jgi:hypothetical protein
MRRLPFILLLLALVSTAYATDLCAGYGAGPDKPFNCAVTPQTGGTSILFTWNSNLPSDSMVLIGNDAAGGGYSRNVCETDCPHSALVTSHSVLVNHLQPNSVYHWSVANCSTPSCVASLSNQVWRGSTNWSISPFPSILTQMPVTTLGTANPSGTISWFAEFCNSPSNVYRGSPANLSICTLLQNGTFHPGVNTAYTTAVTVDAQSCLPGGKLGEACGSTNISFVLTCSAAEPNSPSTNNYYVSLATSGTFSGEYNCGGMGEPFMVARLVTNGSTTLGAHALSITFQMAASGVAVGSPVTATWAFNVNAAGSFSITPPTSFPAIPNYNTWLARIASKGTAEVTQLATAFSNGVFCNDNYSTTQTAYEPCDVFNYDGNMIYKYLGDQAATVSTTWASGSPYSCATSLGGCQIVANGYVWAATTGGTSGGTLPAGFTTQLPGQTVHDGTVVWTNGGNKAYWNKASELVGMPYMDWAQLAGKYGSAQEWNMGFCWGCVMDFYRQNDVYSGVCNGIGNCSGLAAGAVNYLGGVNRPGYVNLVASQQAYWTVSPATVRILPYALQDMAHVCEITSNSGSCLSSVEIAKRVDLAINTIDAVVTYSPFDAVNSTYACCVSAPVFDMALLGNALIYYFDLQHYFSVTPDARIPLELMRLYDWQIANFYNLTGTDYTFPYGMWLVSDNANIPTYSASQQLGNLLAPSLAWLWAMNGSSCTFPTSGLGCQPTADTIFNATTNVVPYTGKSFNEEYQWLNNFTLWRTGAGPATDHYVLPNHNAFEGSYPDVLGPFNGQSFPPNYPAASTVTNNSATIQWYSFEKLVSTKVYTGTTTSAPSGSPTTCGAGTFVAGSLNLWLNQCTVSGLSSSTKYYYSVGGSDTAGNAAQSQFSAAYHSPFSFTTASGGSSLTITTTSPLPNGTVGQPYSFTMTATGGTLPYAWAIVAGSLPTGLSLSPVGLIAGTPTTPGFSPAPLTIRVTDHVSATFNHAYGMTIKSAGSGGASSGSQGEISLGEIIH